MSNLIKKKIFVHCKKCKKRLIERLPNGLWRFRFGKSLEGETAKGPPVEIIVYGSLKIKCIRRNCQEWNTLSFFPGQDEQSVFAELDSPTKDVFKS